MNTVHYTNGIIIALTTEEMVNAWTPAGTFLYYSFLNLLGFGFVHKFIKETSGLSDAEKKSLYAPKEEEAIEFKNVLEMTE